MKLVTYLLFHIQYHNFYTVSKTLFFYAGSFVGILLYLASSMLLPCCHATCQNPIQNISKNSKYYHQVENYKMYQCLQKILASCRNSSKG